MSDQSMNNSVLMVDDEPMVLKGYTRSLRGICDLHTASSGHEALDLIKEHGPYSVIVADMRMPVMDGVELLQNVSLLCPLTIRIMLTGNADQKTAADAVNQGSVYKFFTKPCDLKELQDAILSGIDRYQRTNRAEEESKQNVVRVEHLEQRLTYQARHDILTGLANRTAFEAKISTALDEVKNNNKKSCSVLPGC